MFLSQMCSNDITFGFNAYLGVYWNFLEYRIIVFNISEFKQKKQKTKIQKEIENNKQHFFLLFLILLN